ncbi:hypothetical protein DYB30_009933 [Aphanomyces astaci]|uniref:Uncharacterized protein n=1 Tax=Aphanomyces astaci TaxID=112090 RepID=A0A397D1B1_APHAT|nr:hypothetical protein DYB30_009933 [Aphanomyces astaci]
MPAVSHELHQTKGTFCVCPNPRPVNMYYAHDTVAEENERLRQELKRVMTESKSLQHQVTQLKQAAEREAAFRQVLESEHETLRRFICSSFGLPTSTGSTGYGGFNPTEVPYTLSLTRSWSDPTKQSSSTEDSTGATRVLTKSAEAILASRTPSVVRKGERSVRLQEDWIKEADTPMTTVYGLGSEPWSRLLADWSQGDAKKHDYLNQWLSYHLDGKRDAKSPFSNPRVELKSMNSHMLAGFLQLVVPVLQASRPDLNVDVYTKDYVGHSLRIVLEDKHSRSPAIHDNNNYTAAPSSTCFDTSRGSLRCLAPIHEHLPIR